MDLEKEVYKALEDIIGPEYISQDPAIRDTYNQVWANKMVFGQKFSIRPAAVLLPGNTAEIQAIVKACNRYGVLFKPFSSGFEIMATALRSEKGILLDLRRMNRILEIDVKNMHAVVEPFVSIHRLQREAAKLGLFIGNIGAGPSAGVIAASCAHFGSGLTSVSTGGLDRNVLGAEWVLPTGDILKLGTGGTGDGWFSADGPGISLRGILRGRGGANGGHGVITKASVKLYPWFGPPEWDHVRKPGEAPVHSQIEKPLEGYKAFVFTFPTRDNMFEANSAIAQSELTYALCSIVPGPTSEGNDEMWAAVQKAPPGAGEVMARSLSAVLGTNSKREMEYREKCLLKISEKWGGQLIPEMNDLKAQIDVPTFTFWTLLNIQGVFRPTTEFFISPTIEATQDMIINEHKRFEKVFRRYEKKGAIWQGDIALFNPPYEHMSTGAHSENCYNYDPWDEFSLEETKKMIAETCDPKGEFRRFGVPLLGGALEIEPEMHIHQNWGPLYDNYDVWLRKIKAMLDPNDVGDWSAYIPPVFP